MAAINRGITYTYKKAFTKNGKHYTGFDYTIINTEADAKANNRDIIRIEPFTMKTANGNNYYSLTWTDVKISVYYNGSEIKSGTCTRRYRLNGYGDNNVKYFFKQTTNNTWSGSSPTQNAIGENGEKVNGYYHINTLEKFSSHTNVYEDSSTLTISSNYGLIVTIPHNDDGTPKGSIRVIIGSNRDDGYGNSDTPCKPDGSFTLPKIDRGTKIYQYVAGVGWQKKALIHYKGESSGDQHYIYKYNGSSWVKYYG